LPSRFSEGSEADYDVTVWDVGEDKAWTGGSCVTPPPWTEALFAGASLRIGHISRREGDDWKVVNEYSNWEGDRA